jgi:hypothetical protein
MGGGLMQLVAYGAQDIYLTGNPQITFFKVVYRRHTNFSIESIEQTFNGTADFGKKVSCTISRNGDLLHRVYLQTTLPQQQFNFAAGNLTYVNDTSNTDLKAGIVRWCNWVGEKLVNYAEIEIGGQRIDKHFGEWLHIWNQLTNKPGHEYSYQRMVGNIPSLTKNIAQSGESTSINEQRLYIPLQFWFCRNPGLALPLIALQYHEVKINIEFEELKNLLIIASGAAANSPNLITPNGSLSNTSLWVDYIFLDTDERRRFAQLAHEYLIEQVQYPGEETVSTSSNKIRLNFNHPIKEIFWVSQKNKAIEWKQHFNYTDKLDSSPTLITDPVGRNWLQGVIENIELASNTLADASTTIFSKALSLKNMDTGLNTCNLAKLQLNGQDRFSERRGDYFNYIQPYNHHTRCPQLGLNVYSFGLKPEEHQPSGTCNFSRIDNANLFLTVTNKTINHGAITLTNGLLVEDDSNNSSNAKVRVYAVNYNVLRIMSGMGGLAYSN